MTPGRPAPGGTIAAGVPVPAAAAAGPARTKAARDRRFFLWTSVAVAAVAFAGFSRSYYLRPLFFDAPLTWVFHAHGAVLTAWIALLVGQTALVSARRTDLHRRLGVAGGVVAVLVVVSGYAALITAARRGFAAPVPTLVFLAIPFFDLVVFTALCGTGLALRRSPAAHKRLMLLSTIALLPAAVARLPNVLAAGPPAFFGLSDLLVVAMLVHDRRSRGRLHPATVVGGLLLVGSQVGRLAVSGTGAWQAFARWLVG